MPDAAGTTWAPLPQWAVALASLAPTLLAAARLLRMRALTRPRVVLTVRHAGAARRPFSQGSMCARGMPRHGPRLHSECMHATLLLPLALMPTGEPRHR